MHKSVTIIYNEPEHSRYDTVGEEKAVIGVLEAVEAIHKSLLELKYNVERIGLVPPVGEAEKKIKELKTDLIFNLFEGFPGSPETESVIAEIIASTGIPYTGSPGSTLKLALDKAKVKVLLQKAGIPTPDFQALTPETLSEFKLKFPCIVKPRCEDASHGITSDSVVNDPAALAKQVKFVCSTYGGDALVEEFISGREFNASAMGNKKYSVLPISEMAYSTPPGIPKILTFAAKWEPDSQYFKDTQVVCPASLTAKEKRIFSETVSATFKLIGCRGYARVDLRMDDRERLNVIEINPNPDISPGTGSARQAAAAGMTYTQFIGKIVDLALEKN